MREVDVRTPLQNIAKPGRFGANVAEPGIVIEERTNLALASVIARRGVAERLAAAVAGGYSIALPQGPRAVTNGEITFAGLGSDQWLACSEDMSGPAFVAQLEERLAGLAAVSDQSDARLVLRLSGRSVRQLLAKGIPLDLHPRAFETGNVASTLVAHMGVQIQQLDAGPTYQLMAFRSHAGSLWSWLAASAAEFGVEVK